MIKKLTLALLVAATASSCCQETTTATNYEASWESLSQHDEVPQWLADAKLGMYFHWGVYSVPAFGSEWYPYRMYRQDNPVYEHHQKTYGKDFNYHDFIPMFTAEKFDPEYIAKLFKSTGARFAGPCVLHHDGFAMWDSEVNPWNAADMGPKRDVGGDFLKAVKKEGLKTIATFHHARTLQRNANIPEEWASTGRNDAGFDSHFAYDPSLVTSTTDPKLAKLYGNIPAEEFHQYWFDEIREVVDQYSPDIIWFDSWLNLIPETDRQEMAAYYYNEATKKDQEVTIGYKQHDMPIEVGINDIEQGGKMELSERVWMTDVTISRGSWSYVKGQKYKTANLVIRNMIDVWSKNGVVLLNISPMADGSVPQEQLDILSEIGGWMERNGEAVYDTKPFLTHGFGATVAGAGSHGGQSASTKYTADDIRFTLSKDDKTLYMFFLGAPTPGDVIDISKLNIHRYETPSPIKRITLLNDSSVEAPYHYTTNKMTVTIPDAPMDELATVFRVELE